jgi:hypothetical protein
MNGKEWWNCQTVDYPGKIVDVIGIKAIDSPEGVLRVNVEVVSRKWFRRFSGVTTLYLANRFGKWRYAASGREFPLSHRVFEMYEAWEIQQKANDARDGCKK